ncbi:sugar phosphate isomerase/epimerase family protein [Rubrolithibacter danxiaensis]|uniref:sugar phosphate isomerase/epimerase family protein n=1 Tax=Rubrolithibacter danxiaensis TaxID=3390805 RepID=UPI003BF78A01
MNEKLSRKNFIKSSLLVAANLSVAMNFIAEETGATELNNTLLPLSSSNAEKPKICIFSKHLQWLNYKDMAELVTEIGFDGIDLTVRKGGHVLPEKAVEDLPAAVETVRKAGVDVFMLSTDIQNAKEPFTEEILKAAAAKHIKYYRTGWFEYKNDTTIQDNLAMIKEQFSGLSELNKKHGTCGVYQNHAGANFGSPVWDLWLAIKDFHPDLISCQYDIRHATVEGANSWPLGLNILKNNIRTLDIKDFRWEKNNNNQWQAKSVPLGEGMVDFKKYFSLIKQYNISGPMSLHYEYPLGGAEEGAKKISISTKEFVTAVKKDLLYLKELLKEAEIL